MLLCSQNNYFGSSRIEVCGSCVSFWREFRERGRGVRRGTQCSLVRGHRALLPARAAGSSGAPRAPSRVHFRSAGAPAMAPCSSSTVSWTAARTRRCMSAALCALAFVAGLVTCGEKLAAACVISISCLLPAAACALAVTECDTTHFCQMPALASQACSQRRGRRREEHA